MTDSSTFVTEEMGCAGEVTQQDSFLDEPATMYSPRVGNPRALLKFAFFGVHQNGIDVKTRSRARALLHEDWLTFFASSGATK